MEKYENIKRSKREIFTNNLVGGLAWGIGATLGLALLIALLGIVAHYVNLVPVVGNFVSGVIDFILKKNPNLLGSLPFFWTHFAYA
jgi:hypothetical protein